MKRNIVPNKKAAVRLQEVIARINALFLRVKYAFALWLEGRLSGYSKGKATMALVLFCTAVSLLLVMNSTNSFKAKDNKEIDIQGISKVNALSRNGKSASLPRIPIELQTARKYLDSLARDSTGRKVYDSLIASRPGLLDSLMSAEYYYREMK